MRSEKKILSGNRRNVAALLAAACVLVGAAGGAGAAQVDVAGGVLAYRASDQPWQPGSQLTISLASGVYTIDDPGEGAVGLDPGALAAGCAPVDADTVSCPASAVASLDVATFSGDDAIVLIGATAPSVVSGGPGIDVIVGGGGDDTFVWEPGDGSDAIDGGSGLDTLVFRGSDTSESFTITPEGTGFDLERNANVDLDVDGVEALFLEPRSGSDSIATTALVGTVQHVLDGGGDAFSDSLVVDAEGHCARRVDDGFGNRFEVDGRQPVYFTPSEFPFADVIDSFCAPEPCEAAVATAGCNVNGVPGQPCVGTSGDDRIVGTAGADVILGGGGADRIRAGKGDDLICGEAGDDDLAGGAGDDTIVGADGEDQLKGDGGDDELLGGREADVLVGAAGDDALDGGEGDDWLRGTGGTDTIAGGTGVDRIDGGGGSDVCTDADQSGPFPRCEG